MANYWMVRSDENIRDLVEEGGFVAIGFGGEAIGDISGLSRDQIRNLVEQDKSEASPKQIGSHTGQLYRFAREIQIDDWVITNLWDRQYLIGKITGDYRYDGSDPNHPHRHSVEWHSHRVGRAEMTLL